LAVAVTVNDHDRERRIERRNRCACNGVRANLSWCELETLFPNSLTPPPSPEPPRPPPPKYDAVREPTPSAVAAATLSPKEQEREKKRQELMNESIIAYCGPEIYGPFDKFVGTVPCRWLFGLCAVLMLLGDCQRVMGIAIGAWTLWIWACQTSIYDAPRWM
jgi:hypothetical protein